MSAIVMAAMSIEARPAGERRLQQAYACWFLLLIDSRETEFTDSTRRHEVRVVFGNFVSSC